MSTLILPTFPPRILAFTFSPEFPFTHYDVATAFSKLYTMTDISNFYCLTPLDQIAAAMQVFLDPLFYSDPAKRGIPLDAKLPDLAFSKKELADLFEHAMPMEVHMQILGRLAQAALEAAPACHLILGLLDTMQLQELRRLFHPVIFPCFIISAAPFTMKPEPSLYALSVDKATATAELLAKAMQNKLTEVTPF